MSSFMPCGCSKKSEWYYRGKWHELPVPRCGACGVEVNGCRKHGAFFSINWWEYVCDVCLRQRQEKLCDVLEDMIGGLENGRA